MPVYKGRWSPKIHNYQYPTTVISVTFSNCIKVSGIYKSFSLTVVINRTEHQQFNKRYHQVSVVMRPYVQRCVFPERLIVIMIGTFVDVMGGFQFILLTTVVIIKANKDNNIYWLTMIFIRVLQM